MIGMTTGSVSYIILGQLKPVTAQKYPQMQIRRYCFWLEKGNFGRRNFRNRTVLRNITYR